MEGASVHISEQTLWVRFCFPCMQCFFQTIICGLVGCLIIMNAIVVFHIALLLIGTLFTANEVQQWACSHRIHCYYCLFHHPAAAGFIEWDDLLKTQFQHQLGSNTLQGCRRFSRGCICSELSSVIWYYFSRSQDLQVQQWRGKMGVAPLFPLVTHPQHFCCFHNLRPCWPRSFSFKGNNASNGS